LVLFRLFREKKQRLGRNIVRGVVVVGSSASAATVDAVGGWERALVQSMADGV